MKPQHIRKTIGQMFALLDQPDPTRAGQDFVRLCALCALRRCGWMPKSLSPDEEWRFAAAALPRLFPGGITPPPGEWFGSGGPAELLLDLYQSAAEDEVFGLSGRLWEIWAELPRRQSFAALRATGRHTHAANATQLFTPGWLGRFLVENSAGRLLGHGEDTPYYMENPADPFPSADPARLTLLDPCAGGGELLCRGFDLLLPRLVQGGMPPAAAAQHLLEHSLCGLDLDPNALNTCYLELMLRARRADPQLFQKAIHPRLAVVENIDGAPCAQGSLFAPQIEGFEALVPEARELLSTQYDIVAANPPYMGLRAMPAALRGFLRRHYPAGRGDLYAAFALRCLELTKPGGCTALLMPQGWLTLASFEELRGALRPHHIPVLLKLGAHAFPDLGGEVVQAAAFVAAKNTAPGSTALCDLCAFGSSGEKEAAFLAGQNRSLCPKILEDHCLPGGCRPLAEAARICQGLATGDNDRFVRLWYEVDPAQIDRTCQNRAQAQASGKRWFPYNKGGGFRRWWGNDLYVVDFADDGRAIREQTAPSGRPRARVQNSDYYFRPGVSWSFVGSQNFSARVVPPGMIFDVGGSTAFPYDGNLPVLAALLNSSPIRRLLRMRNPTVNFQVGDLAALPCPELAELQPEVEKLAQTCLEICRRRWEQAEPAPAFAVHPWAAEKQETLEQTALVWKQNFLAEEQALCAAQNRLNHIFAELLQTDGEEEPPAAAPDLAEECRRFLSWCVGVVVGRFGGEETDCIPLWDCADGLAARVEELLARLWGPEQLAEALGFLARQLGWKGDPHTALAEYFRGNFWAHHNKLYQNRPVYWLCPHRECPVLLYYHALNADTAKRLAKLRQGGMTAELKQAKKLWNAVDKNLGIAHHLRAAAELGLTKLPPPLARKAAKNQ
ncbi:MAG: hypothetical protein IJ508_04320 [Oscillospiraceae bacterium]|nr:hypothetical protein [Oscillospiraceae bacterium]